MGKLSIREAVKHFQVSRPTLTKALRSGKISGEQDGKSQWSIDPSELARIYKPRTSEVTTLPPNEVAKLPIKNTFHPIDLQDLRDRLATAELRAATAETRAEAAELLAKERAERIEDLRRMLPPPVQPKRRRWWLRG